MASVTIASTNQTKTPVAFDELANYLEVVLRRLGQADTVKLVTATSQPGQELPWIELVVVGDSAITKLNRKFFNRTSPTDVLSFPASSVVNNETNQDFLGSIVISAETAGRQAKRAGLSLQEEFKTLTGHGLLHLLGYHHL